MAGGLLGGAGDALLGDQSAQDRKAKAALDAAMAQYQNLNVPELQNINPDLYQYQGDLNLQGVDGGQDVDYSNINSKFDDVASDPALRAKQLAGMSALDDIISSGGLTMSDKANLAGVENEAAAGDAGRRGAILQGMQARGMGGSGMELLAQLQSSQAATNRAAQAGRDVAGSAQDRALNAIMQQGSLAGSVRGQDYGEASTQASAQDAISKFNAQNSLQNAQYNKGNAMDVAKTNAGIANQAAATNYAGKQDISNMNTGAQNTAEMYNKGQKELSQFDMDKTKTAGIADQYGAQAAYQQNKAAQEAAKNGQVLAAAGSIAGGATMMSDKRVKKDIEPLSHSEIREFLTAVNPKKYRYKDPDTDTTKPGERMGFLLQDVQGTDLGKKITQTMPDGKMAYDKDNLDGIMLAALSDLMKDKKGES